MNQRFSFKVEDEQFKIAKGNGGYCHPGGIIHSCVAVAKTKEGFAVRNSNDPTKTTVFFDNNEWASFLRGAKEGQFD